MRPGCRILAGFLKLQNIIVIRVFKAESAADFLCGGAFVNSGYQHQAGKHGVVLLNLDASFKRGLFPRRAVVNALCVGR